MIRKNLVVNIKTLIAFNNSSNRKLLIARDYENIILLNHSINNKIINNNKIIFYNTKNIITNNVLNGITDFTLNSNMFPQLQNIIVYNHNKYFTSNHKIYNRYISIIRETDCPYKILKLLNNKEEIEHLDNSNISDFLI